MTVGYDGLWAVNNRTSRGNYCRLLIEAAAKGKRADKFYIYSDKPNNSSHLVSLLANPKVTMKTPHYSYSAFLWRTGGIRKDLRRHHVRIYHGLSGYLPARSGNCNVHWMLHVNDLYFIHDPKQMNWWQRFNRKRLLKRSSHKAERITVPSEWGKQDLCKQLNINPEIVDVVPPCCSEIFHQPAADWACDDVRRTNNLPEKYILAMGPLERYKHFDMLLKALTKTNNKDVFLVLVGNNTGHYLNHLRPLVDRLNLRGRVLHLKHVRTSDLPALYQMSTALACPTTNSYYSISMLEAMSMGIPTIVSTGTALEEEGGDAVLTAPYDNPELWAKAIDSLFDEDTHARFSQLARQRASEFSLERTGEALHGSYAKVPMHSY